MLTNKNAILIFISGHGYGHISRMQHVLIALAEQFKDSLSLIVITQSNPDFLKRHKNLKIFSIQHDIGLIQKDSFNVDFNKTITSLQNLYKNTNKITQDIITKVSSFNIKAVLSDTSPMGLVVAKKMNIPGIFIGNFTWLDIYIDLMEVDPRFSEFINLLTNEYKTATHVFSLPLSTKLKPFDRNTIIKIPFIAPKPSKMTKTEWETITGIKMGAKKVILLSFGGFDFNNLPVDIIDSFPDDYLFISTRAKGRKQCKKLVVIDKMCLDYLGLIKYCDLIVTKPGYGIITDSIIHQKPLLYTERGRFAEYNILVNWLQNNHPSSFISNQELNSGIWRKKIDTLLSSQLKFKDFTLNGAKEIASRIKVIINA